MYIKHFMFFFEESFVVPLYKFMEVDIQKNRYQKGCYCFTKNIFSLERRATLNVMSVHETCPWFKFLFF